MDTYMDTKLLRPIRGNSKKLPGKKEGSRRHPSQKRQSCRPPPWPHPRIGEAVPMTSFPQEQRVPPKSLSLSYETHFKKVFLLHFPKTPPFNGFVFFSFLLYHGTIFTISRNSRRWILLLHKQPGGDDLGDQEFFAGNYLFGVKRNCHRTLQIGSITVNTDN